MILSQESVSALPLTFIQTITSKLLLSICLFKFFKISFVLFSMFYDNLHLFFAENVLFCFFL